jgi:hypothetical protein
MLHAPPTRPAGSNLQLISTENERAEATAQQMQQASLTNAEPSGQVPKVPPAAQTDAHMGASNTEAKDSPKPNAQKNLNISEKLWNEAYDLIQKDEKELAEFYVATLRASFEEEGGKAKEISAAEAVEISAKLNDRTTRRGCLNELLIKGQEKVKKTSQFSKILGDVAGGILMLQPVMDIVTSVPQAAVVALPWAGVCIGLQVSSQKS